MQSNLSACGIFMLARHRNPPRADVSQTGSLDSADLTARIKRG
jgi:hypothetical protein